MFELLVANLVVGERYWNDGHMDGDWWWMALMMSVLVAVVVVLVIWIVRRGESTLRQHQSPEEILKRRLADGSIEVEEYERRLDALRNGK